MNWRRRLKGFARQFGLDIVRFHPETSDSAKVRAVLRYLNIDLVLDVGANTGQYAQGLREGGYRGRIVSFEPLTSAHATLERNAARDNRWTVHPRCAIGDREGQITINVAGNSVSSSVLPMLAQHANSAPESRYIGSETVPLSRLDSAAAPYLVDAGGVYLKIDTQGFEAVVLAGASELLPRCRAVQLELSLVPLYEGQRLWQDFLGEFAAKGFELWTLLPGFVDAESGRTLQTDAVFVRPDHRAQGPTKALIAAHFEQANFRNGLLSANASGVRWTSIIRLRSATATNAARARPPVGRGA